MPVPGVLGTSASCPVVAGILAHINDYRLRSNLPPLGFVNPLLYKNPEALTDVTQGYNAGCDLSEYYDRGFYAQKGWDPVTGLGNPNFPTMLKGTDCIFIKLSYVFSCDECCSQNTCKISSKWVKSQTICHNAFLLKILK